MSATDGVTYSQIAVVTWTVHAVNDPPIANPISYTVQHDQKLTVGGVGVLSTSSDSEGDPLNARLVSRRPAREQRESCTPWASSSVISTTATTAARRW